MKHHLSIDHKSRRKLIMRIAFCLAMVCTSIAAAAQQESVKKEERQLAKLVRQFVNATTKALRQDEKVKKHDDQQQFAIQALERRPLEPLNRNLFVPAIYPETPPLVPASGPPPTEEEVTELLKDYLAKDWPKNRQTQKVGLASSITLW